MLIEERQNRNETDSYILVSFNVFSAARFEYHFKEIDILEFPNELKNKHQDITEVPKDSFLRALREVAQEMELFLENHGYFYGFKIFANYVN